MILTGPEIAAAIVAGDIWIEPFMTSNINPNSYDYRLGENLIRFGSEAKSGTRATIPEDGYLLEPGYLYLGATYELIGSKKYVTTLLGCSSIGRLGIFLNATADLGHVGSHSRWTLELSVVQPVFVFRRMRIGQVAFWAVEGERSAYSGRYHGDLRPQACKDSRLEAQGKDCCFDPIG